MTSSKRDGTVKAVVDGIEFDLEFRNGSITCNGKSIDASLVRVGKSAYSLIIDGRSYELTIQTNGKSTQITESGLKSEVRILDRAGLMQASLGDSARTDRRVLEIRAPMPGLVLAVEVEPGATVTSGQGLIVLEAMKMENEIFSAGAGIVETVHVATGDAVTKGQLLVTLEGA